jgi:hypothetical protein
MQIQTNWTDAERMAAALTTSIVDSMALAGSDASETLLHCREAAQYANTLARFLENIAEGLDGKVQPYEPPEIEKRLEAEVYGVRNVEPITRINGQEAG